MDTRTVKIEKILSSIVGSYNYYTVLSDFFEMSAISIRNAVDYSPARQEYEERYLRIIKKYPENERNKFSEALGAFISLISESIDKKTFYDWAGEMYMNSQTSSKSFGQFFTPYEISKLMAMLTFDCKNFAGKIQQDRNYIISLNEPTCGAGGIIVAAMEVLYNQGINYSWNTFVDCTDIDARCVHMAYVTLSLLGVPAIVRLGNSLTMEYRETWYTPALILSESHFVGQLKKQNNQKECVALPKNDYNEIKFKVEKNGQCALIF